MANASEVKQLFINTLEAKGVKYTDISSQIQVVRLGWSTKFINGLNVTVFFDEDGDSVHVGTQLPLNIPEDKLAQALVEVNSWNKRLRWIDLYLDDDSTIMGEMDAVVEPTTAGEEIFELVIRMVSICDDVYPSFARLIWS